MILSGDPYNISYANLSLLLSKNHVDASFRAAVFNDNGEMTALMIADLSVSRFCSTNVYTVTADKK